MVVYREGNRRRLILLLVIVTAVALITLDLRGGGPLGVVRRAARDTLSPLQSATDAVFSPIGDWLDGVTRAGQLQDENERLRRQLDDARGQLAESQDALQENEQLQQLLDIPYVEDIDAVTARVVSGAPGNFQETVEIDKGTGDGVEKGMPVVTGAGLIGTVTEVAADRSSVELVTDPDSTIGVRLVNTGTLGIAKGRLGEDELVLDFVAPDVEVIEEEQVFTSGLEESALPPDIPVAYVTSVNIGEGALEQDIRLKPLADLEALEHVKVLKWTPP
ncbi:MAG: rod shape-determining protein MreC [Acidimicrobiia bacterium]